jgi:pantoate--beta-alanine ligase
MEIISDPRAMLRWARATRAADRSLGFVPTMGALHAGHLNLCERARGENEMFAASIFVNPLQFAPHEDLQKYPRPFERDCSLLQQAGCDVLFAPVANEEAQNQQRAWVEVPHLGTRWEGAARPGHLRGVATIVTSLFLTCQPSRAYFGEKDWQQLKVVQQLAKNFFPDLEIVPCETVREADGLALSSRNAYLSSEERAAALCLSRGLFAARDACAQGEHNGPNLEALLRQMCEREPLASVEYCAVVDEATLEPLEQVQTSARALMAVRIGGTRLIDNLQLLPA